MSLTKDIVCSWAAGEGEEYSTAELLDWIRDLNASTYVDVRKSFLSNNDVWFYDDYNGEVLNRKRSFFSVRGMRYFIDGEFIREQPIIDQPEIGYLGIISKKINGVLHFLMQAKIEPGNVNCVQISPTVQATKSNFTRAHGGKLPLYFEYFENAERYHVLYDQIQSEQAARFYHKRNRNMLMRVDEMNADHPNFRWMTLGQIKKLMSVDNLVNMDTRTVLSGLPLISEPLTADDRRDIRKMYTDEGLFKSTFENDLSSELPAVFQKLNDYKMFREVTVSAVPLNQLVDWTVDDCGINCKKKSDFSVAYYDIEIAGREVRHWFQPLFRANGKATFGLLSKIIDGKRKFLIRLKPEIGSFDKVEFGPSVQREPTYSSDNDDPVEVVFDKYIEKRNGILRDVVLSEEGGRFYHEQNRNVIIEIVPDELPELPDDALWVSYGTLNHLCQSNNYLNIQLRNLLSLLNI